MKKMTGEQEGDKGQGEHPSRETTGVLGHLAPPGNRNSEQTAVPVGRPFPSVSVLTPHLGEAEGEWRHHLPAVMASLPPADLEPSLP